MSIPLSTLPISSTSNTFLDPDERFEVFQVKVAERPYLLAASNDDDNSNDDDYPLPLLDGCDLPAWRRHGLVGPLSLDLLGALHIGAGSTLFRRESQWPLLHDRAESPWNVLKQRLSIPPKHDIPRVGIKDVSQRIDGKTKFALEWEERNIPVLIEGCMRECKAMPVYTEHYDESNVWNGGGQGGWTFENLLRRFGTLTWRFSDTHGQVMSLETFAKYTQNLEGLSDDAPLAIYDSEFGNSDSPTSVLLQEYKVPPCFSQDLFEYSLDKRPPYRWILIGPPRSGTGLHIDPLYTNAWVTLLQGTKCWLLFPPDTPPSLIGMDGPIQIPASIWFYQYYDKVTGDDFRYKPVQVLQKPGETVFVPCGWPHLVLNLTLTVAVTHNYASEHGPLDQLWENVITEEPEFAADWIAGLKQHRPDLVERIRKVIKQDF